MSLKVGPHCWRRTNIQRLALKHINAVLVAGGFDVDPFYLELGNSGQTPILCPSSMIPILWRPCCRALANMCKSKQHG